MARVPNRALCRPFNELINNFIARQRPDQAIWGFDTFEGLKEDWAGSKFAKGTFDVAGCVPAVLPNVRLVAGWFHETLPRFFAEHRDKCAFIHIDCDTYEAAATVLNAVAARLVPGTVVVFDKYLGYRGWRQGGVQGMAGDCVCLRDSVRIPGFLNGTGCYSHHIKRSRSPKLVGYV
ncbi:MAG: class I SAM-dependent methyltransferase [Veillonellaceae bacterium]|nr:class I SAM-dependent methyltransferase [Veillonellaceae bacterium]